MTKANVYFTDFHMPYGGDPLPVKLHKLMKKAGFEDIDMKGKLIIPYRPVLGKRFFPRLAPRPYFFCKGLFLPVLPRLVSATPCLQSGQSSGL